MQQMFLEGKMKDICKVIIGSEECNLVVVGKVLDENIYSIDQRAQINLTDVFSSEEVKE